jgi:trans-aconitate 2-methyltransferase
MKMAFEFDGKKYAKVSTHQKEWGEKLISELRLQGNERILDLGCGDGRLTAQLAELVPGGYVVGIDASAGMIAEARKHQRPNLTFEVMDINQFGFEQSFDLIFSNATLHWIKDHSRLLKKAFAYLNEGGTLCINFAGKGNCSHYFKVMMDVISRAEYQESFQDFEWPWFMPSLGEYQILVQQIPFRDVRIWEENADRYFPDQTALIGWIDQPSIVPFLAPIQEENREKFRDEVVREMVMETQCGDGRYFETFRRINVLAQK